MIGVLGAANRAEAIGFVMSIDACTSVSNVSVTGCAALDQGTGVVSYSFRLTQSGSLMTLSSANVYKTITCSTDDLVVALGSARAIPNPLRGEYTLTADEQADMLAGQHRIKVATVGGDVWIAMDKGPPGACFIATVVPRCSSTARAVPDVSGCLVLDYNSGLVEYDIEIDPFPGSTDATADVYNGSNTESCTLGTTVLDEPLCSFAMPSTQDWCYNPLVGSYLLDTIEERDDMLAGRHHIIVTWPQGDSRQGPEVWIAMFSGRNVPAVTTWGLIVLTLLLVAGGTCVFARRKLSRA
jgi:hypothetical protein